MLVEALKFGFRSGYRRTSLFLNRVFNVLLSLVLILVCLPVYAIIALLILVLEGRPLFYMSKRLGLNKAPFNMYKFRTLSSDADEILGSRLAGDSRSLMTPLGSILRDTRLDELPQLLNILLGDMDFLGPRPERPEVYEALCRHIRGYDKRFTVKPGLLGFSQVFTPHSTPKRIRVAIDNSLVRRKQRILWDIIEVFLTGLVVLRSAVGRLARAFYRGLILRVILRRFQEKRDLERSAQNKSLARRRPTGDWTGFSEEAELVDVNERAFLIRSDRPLEFSEPDPSSPGEPFQLTMMFTNHRGIRKRKTARCYGRLFREGNSTGGAFQYVIEYEPATPLNFYKVHRYFLRKSLAL